MVSANWLRRLTAGVAALGTAALAIGLQTGTASATNALAPFCDRLVQNPGLVSFPTGAIAASSGALMACFGAQPNGGSGSSGGSGGSSTSGSSKNVDAANPHEDVTPSGVQVYGQSEVSTAATGNYVVEAWNDATGFFNPCPDPSGMFKEELTGLGFSSNSGASFTDLGGLPNDCSSGFKYYGDPTVETYTAGGNTYFYIASLYINPTSGQSDLAMDACLVAGATLKCQFPTIIATGSLGDFLDKEFMTVDQQRAKLYISYTRFGAAFPTASGQIELARCDISSPATPSCSPGASPAPYFVVAPGDSNGCENEGAYPAVDLAKGDVYVAWEYNWATNYINCTSIPTQNKVAYIPFACLTPGPTSPCAAPAATNGVKIQSIDLAFIPGFNRNPASAAPANDFPRIAVSDPYNTVSIVWNDTRLNVLGDIFLQSWTLQALAPVQPSPISIDTVNGGLHFMPALRNANAMGLLNVSWFQRSDPNTTLTDVYINTKIDPTSTKSLSTNTRITDVQSDWGAVSSDIEPNFGDYTDNYVIATSTAPYTDSTVYVAWSDGRLAIPQPFNADISS